MSFEFVTAEPVKRNVPGRTAEPNPFTDVIADIALKVDDAGKPLARKFVLDVPGNEDEKFKIMAKVRRQLTKAGHDNDPEVTVFCDFAPHVTGHGVAKKTHTDKCVVTFWTVKRQLRPRAGSDEATPTE